jgi:hypothetical protein
MLKKSLENIFTYNYKIKLKAKLKDARPDVGFQVGVTPEFTEEPKCHKDIDCQKLISQV